MPRPPVTSRVWPVTYDASGEARLERQLVSKRIKIEAGTYNSMPAAASSALAPLCRGMSTKALTLLSEREASGMPNATFLPSMSMVTPSSFAAVNLYPVRCCKSKIQTCHTGCAQGRRQWYSRGRQTVPILLRWSW